MPLPPTEKKKTPTEKPIEDDDLVKHSLALPFISKLKKESVDLFLIDPPYFGIVKETWDNQWLSERHYVKWLCDHVFACIEKMKPNGSLVMFGGIGRHGSHPLFMSMFEIEKKLTFRNMITWKKRRAYGKSHDYLFCREEILWYTKSAEKKNFTFNIPLTDVKRGYAGWDKRYSAKSEYKRVSNVWDDIGELMRPSRNCEKPLPLLKRLVATHSNPGDLVVDFFAGTGVTGVAALQLDRRFMGCDAMLDAVKISNARFASPFELQEAANLPDDESTEYDAEKEDDHE